jgi:hypothetical protein
MDDSGLWDSFRDNVRGVGLAVKPKRRFVTLPVLTPMERDALNTYDEQLGTAMKSLEAMRLLVEGHFMKMQNYLFIQTGNSRTVNVLEISTWLLVRLCKDTVAADITTEQEFECISCVLSLLMELTQGPNVNNQDFLSQLGLVEAVFKIIRSNFKKLQEAANDVYPSSARTLKALLLETLLALMEGRQDNKVQLAMMQSIDIQTLMERIQFVYAYYIFGTIAVSRGKLSNSSTNVALPLGTHEQSLIQTTGDPGELFTTLDAVDDVAYELLEDLDDDELDELFSEGIDFIQLILELSPHSREFELHKTSGACRDGDQSR